MSDEKRVVSATELDRRFSSQTVGQVGTDAMADIRGNARQLAERIVNETPYSREQSLSLTHLEEVVFWANKAISLDQGLR